MKGLSEIGYKEALLFLDENLMRKNQCLIGSRIGLRDNFLSKNFISEISKSIIKNSFSI